MHACMRVCHVCLCMYVCMYVYYLYIYMCVCTKVVCMHVYMYKQSFVYFVTGAEGCGEIILLSIQAPVTPKWEFPKIGDPNIVP